MLRYQRADWAVRTWDWFNEGRLIEPLSFCQFWRTVLLYATLKRLLWPFGTFYRLIQGLRLPFFFLPSILGHLFLLAGRASWPLLCFAARTAWFLTSPLRSVARLGGRAALAGAVNLGEPVKAFGEAHETGLRRLYAGFLIVYFGVAGILLAVLLLLPHWFWAMTGLGGLIVGGFASYGFVKSGVGGLLWEAAVAAKHGICPPVWIERES